MGNSLALTIKLDADGNLVGKLNQANQSVDDFSKEINKAKSASDRLADRLTDMSHIAIGAFSLNGIYEFHKQLLETTATIESMGKAYAAVFGKSQASDQMQWVASLANQMGLSLMDATEQFKLFSAATKNTSLEGEHTRSIFMATASAATTLGLSTETTNRAFLALSQMASKGTVSMEELRGQLGEAIPGAMNMAADAMGVSVQELDKMVSNGQVLAGELLPKLADEMQKMYGASANGASNLSAELNRLDSATMSLGAAYTSGWVDDATAIIRDMTIFFTDPSVVAGAKSIGEGVGTLMHTISDNKEATLAVIGALMGFMRAGGIGAVVGAIGGFSFSQIINQTDVERIKALKHDLENLHPTATNWALVDQKRADMQAELSYLEDWANVSKGTYQVVYDTAAKAEADKTAAALAEAKKRSVIAATEYDDWSKNIDDLNKYDFEQRKKSIADFDESERKRVAAAKKSANDILQAKKQAQDQEYNDFEKMLNDQEKAQADYQKSIEDTFAQVRRDLDPTLALYEKYGKQVEAVLALTVAGSTEQIDLIDKLKDKLAKDVELTKQKTDETLNTQVELAKNALKRLDDAFANTWEGIFSGAQDFGSSMKSWFTRLMAELAHAAITKPIVVSITSALGLGGTGTAMAGSAASSMAGSWIGGAMGSASSALGFAGTGASSILGGFGSMGSSISTGMLNINSGFALEGISQIAGTVLPVIGAALAIDSLTSGAISTGIMGGARGERARSLNIGIHNGVVDDTANIYRATHYDAGWGRSGSWNVDNLGGSEFNQIIKDTVNTMAISIRDNAQKLGFAFNESFSGQFDADLFGKTAEETQKIISDTFSRIGQGMVDGVIGLSDAMLPLQKSGEQTYETLARVVSQFDAFNQPIGRLNDSLTTLNITTISAVDALVSMSGGMQNLQTMQSGFINAFYTDAQKSELTTQTVTRLFDGIGMSAPASREALVSLVHGLDLTTESGQRAYLAITGATSTLDQFYSTIERQPDMVSNNYHQSPVDHKQLVNDAFSALKNSVQVELDAISQTYNSRVSALSLETDAIKKNISALSTMRSALQSTYDAITASTSNPLSRYTSGQSTLQSILSSYRLGIAPVQAELDRALHDVSLNDQAYYASFEDYARDQAITSGLIAQIMTLTDDSLSVEDRTLATIDAQLVELKRQYDLDVSALNQTLASYQEQVNAINGVNESVLSVQDAIASLSSALSGAISSSHSVAGSVTPSYAYDAYSVNDTSAIRQAKVEAQTGQVVSASDSAQLAAAKVLYQSVTGGANTAQYNAALDAIGGSFSNIGWDGSREGAAALVRQYGGSLPSFASGGDHVGGIRLVGENGPELEVTGPSRIFNAQQTQNILKNSDNSDALISEIRALRAEVSSLRDENKQLSSGILSESRKQARVMEKWDADGMPQAVIA